MYLRGYANPSDLPESARPISRAARLLAALGCASLLLYGCAAAIDGRSSVYVEHDVPGVLQWIGEPGGEPVWAADGSAIAWGSEDGLMRSDLGGRVPEVVAEGAVVGRPEWAPDASALAYVDRNSASLVVVDSDSGTVVFGAPIATGDAASVPRALPSFGGPDWSPDGSRVAFNCWDGLGEEVCVVDADGSDRRQVTRIEPTNGAGESRSGAAGVAASNTGPPSWSPDGASLAIAAYPERRGAVSGVFVVDLEDGTARQVSSLLPNSEIAWFADGKSLLFSASDKGRSDAVKVSATSGSTEKLTAALPAGANHPALSRDGTRLAVASNGTLVVMDLQGDGQSEVGLPAGLSGSAPAWSPTTDAIAFAAAPDPIANYS